MDGKQCKACGETKPVDNFYVAYTRKSGIVHYQPKCKECVKAEAKIKNAQPEAIERRKEEWAKIKADPEAHKEVIEQAKQWRREHGVKEFVPAVVDGKRKCTICGETKPVDEFYKTPSGNPGSRCKECDHKRNGQRSKGNREKLNAYLREYWKKRNANKPKRQLLTEEEKRERRRRYGIERARKNGVKPKIEVKGSVSNPSAYSKQYRKDRIARDPNFLKTLRNYRRIRYARHRGATGSHTVDEWEALKAQYNYTCLCCKKQEPEIALSRDHVLPLTMGGSDDIANIQPLCFSCNARKNDKHIDYR